MLEKTVFGRHHPNVLQHSFASIGGDPGVQRSKHERTAERPCGGNEAAQRSQCGPCKETDAPADPGHPHGRRYVAIAVPRNIDAIGAVAIPANVRASHLRGHQSS